MKTKTTWYYVEHPNTIGGPEALAYIRHCLKDNNSMTIWKETRLRER